VNLYWLPFKRGADGLTRRQRARYARAYTDAYRELTPGVSGPFGRLPDPFDSEAGVSRYPHRGGIGWQPGKGKP